MYCTNRKVLSDMQGLDRFMGQGLSELGDKFGPILWQFMGNKHFEPEDFDSFLTQLPRTLDGLPLRHVMEPRHDSFKSAEFIAMCRKHQVAICLADHGSYPMIADVTADFVYARLQTGVDENPTAYTDEGLDLWAGRLDAYSRGETPAGLPKLAEAAPKKPRDVFAYIISGGKVHAPVGAVALQKKLDEFTA
jgi:uncharacterized protein YecE (DUF72 family)